MTRRDVLGEYAAFLRSLVDLSAGRPLRVVVDAGNGMAGHTVPAVLGAGAGLLSLPLEIIPLYFELDGTFPNHEANPWNRRTCATCSGPSLSTSRTSAWPSTATPIAVSSSTSAANR